MKENINNLTRLSDLKRSLVENNVSANAITSIEKALRSGLIFKRPADLGILNLPVADIRILETAVGFGNPAPAANVRTLQFSFKPTANEEYFFGYQFVITYTNRDKFTIAESFPIEDIRVVYVDLDFNDILDGTRIIYQVKTSVGDFASIAIGNASSEPKEEFLEVEKAGVQSTVIRVKVDSVKTQDNPDVNSSYQVKGKLISASDDKTEGYQIVLMAALKNTDGGVPDFFPVGFANTETNGYFVTGFLIFNQPLDAEKLIAGKAVISKEDKLWEQPFNLLETAPLPGTEGPVKKSIPPRLILVIKENKSEPGKEDDCNCGCNDLNFHEKKVLEEYSYYTVVRTTEPAIIADTLEDEEEVDLDEIYGTGGRISISVFRKYQASVKTLVKPLAAISAINSDTSSIAPPSTLARLTTNTELKSTMLNQDLLHKLVVESKVANTLKGKSKRQFKGRSYLNPMNQIDWDEEPTIYQAASVAHGHLLHFKQEWLPDGYSIGDILYSLPLAPGQKKQIAVLDWERRESAANSQSLDYEEHLNNTLVRDRDINEVVSATLNENIKGSSRATTSGFGFGMGGAVMGVFNGGTFGALHGISGGKSSSGSTASQNSHRDSTANSMQSISDRTSQAASMVRSQRATVIQTVSQGERVQATSESVANYNHCHAITIQYFEVLRHFNIRTRLAGVQECLFIPLQITPFNLEKVQRWRNTLEVRLFRRQLLKGFDAIGRILNEKENDDNYYDSIGYPRKHFAEQAMKVFSGELFIEFTFFNTNEGKISDDMIRLLRVFGINIDTTQNNDRTISNTELAEMVGPRTIEFLLNTIVIETDKGHNLRLDLTLLNRFRQNALLQVSVRQSADTPTYIRRELVDGIKIRIDKSKLSVEDKDAIEQLSNKFMKITIRSGNLRYRSDNMSGRLFFGSINNDLFADNDGVYLPAPLNGDELRNPRGEDIDAANQLIQHLNENLEYYHKCIWFDMTSERRYMLLDGIIAPGKANGRSVASVVENKLIGIAGNSLIMPVAPGNQLDPSIDQDFNLFAQYYKEDNDPIRLSLPTKGVYAESVMGKCNACEEKDESRFWRWEESPIPDSPNTQILPLNTDSRRADPGNLQAKDFPAPVVNIQNAPNVPDPSGLQAILQLIGKGDSFRDITGLNQNQLNALAAFQKSLDTAQAFGKEAAELAKAAAANKLIEDAQKSGAVSNEKAKELTEKNINAAIPPSKEETMGLAQKQLDLINSLEQQGGLTSEDAQNARKSIIENLSKGIDTAGTSAGDLGSLMEKASKFGTDVKKDGESFEIGTGLGLGKPLIIDVKTSATLRSFGPATNKTGKVKLSVKSKNAPVTATLTWMIPPSESGKYTITQVMKGDVSEVEISGITPGLTRIAVVLEDGGNTIASQIHPLCIPQFVSISEVGASPTTLFEDFLNRFGVVGDKGTIVTRMKTVSDDLLSTCNVRTIWGIAPFNESVPSHIPADRVTTLVIENDPAPGFEGSIGVTMLPAGPTVLGELIRIFPGEMTNIGSASISIDLSAIASDIQTLGLVAGMKPIFIEMLGRFLGMAISHEIIHSLLGFLIFSGHNSPAIPGDIMNQGGDLTFAEATGFQNNAMSSPVQPTDFTDRTTAAISRLQAQNQGLIDGLFPVPPAFR